MSSGMSGVGLIVRYGGWGGRFYVHREALCSLITQAKPTFHFRINPYLYLTFVEVVEVHLRHLIEVIGSVSAEAFNNATEIILLVVRR